MMNSSSLISFPDGIDIRGILDVFKAGAKVKPQQCRLAEVKPSAVPEALPCC
jgi:hypothetical protein